MSASEVWWRRAAAAVGSHGVVLGAVWGFAEATVWFIVPDVIVGLAALLSPRTWWKVAAATVAASLAGGLVMLSLAATQGAATRDVVDAVPGVSAAMIADTGADLEEHGGASLVRAPLSGVPYKVYAVEMGDRRWGIGSFLGWSLPSRALRIVPVAAVAAAVGSLFAGLVRRRLGTVLAIYGLGWAVVYAVYFSSVGL